MARRRRNSRFRRTVALGGALTLAGALTISVAAAADRNGNDDNIDNCKIDPDNDIKDDSELKREDAQNGKAKAAFSLVKIIRFEKDVENGKDNSNGKKNVKKNGKKNNKKNNKNNDDDCDLDQLKKDSDQAKKDFDPAEEKFDSIGDGTKTFEDTFPEDPADEDRDANDFLRQDLSDVKREARNRQKRLGQAPNGQVVETCQLSHRNTDNFIVTPGVIDGAQHIHNYFGNTTINAFSTPENALSDEDSTCADQTNKSGYWTPSITRSKSGEEVQPKDFKVVYQGYEKDVGEVTRIPMGMVMIAGDAKNIDPKRATAKYVCKGQENEISQADFAKCEQGQDMIRIQDLPSCWDGKNLDSDDHKSHVVFPQNGKCPRGNSVPLPRIQYQETYDVNGNDSIELSSFPEALGLTSSDHVDHLNLVSQQSMQDAVDCINNNQDCRLGKNSNNNGNQQNFNDGNQRNSTNNGTEQNFNDGNQRNSTNNGTEQNSTNNGNQQNFNDGSQQNFNDGS